MDPTKIANLKKKLGMMRAIIVPFKRAKGVAGTQAIEDAEAQIDLTKQAMEEERHEDAETHGKKAGELLMICAKNLPKTPRKLILPKIEQICRY